MNPVPQINKSLTSSFGAQSFEGVDSEGKSMTLKERFEAMGLKDEGRAISPEKWEKVMERDRGGKVMVVRVRDLYDDESEEEEEEEEDEEGEEEEGEEEESEKEKVRDLYDDESEEEEEEEEDWVEWGEGCGWHGPPADDEVEVAERVNDDGNDNVNLHLTTRETETESTAERVIRGEILKEGEEGDWHEYGIGEGWHEDMFAHEEDEEDIVEAEISIPSAISSVCGSEDGSVDLDLSLIQKLSDLSSPDREKIVPTLLVDVEQSAISPIRGVRGAEDKIDDEKTEWESETEEEQEEGTEWESETEEEQQEVVEEVVEDIVEDLVRVAEIKDVVEEVVGEVVEEVVEAEEIKEVKEVKESADQTKAAVASKSLLTIPATIVEGDAQVLDETQSPTFLFPADLSSSSGPIVNFSSTISSEDTDAIIQKIGNVVPQGEERKSKIKEIIKATKAAQKATEHGGEEEVPRNVNSPSQTIPTPPRPEPHGKSEPTLPPHLERRIAAVLELSQGLKPKTNIYDTTLVDATLTPELGGLDLEKAELQKLQKAKFESTGWDDPDLTSVSPSRKSTPRVSPRTSKVMFETLPNLLDTEEAEEAERKKRREKVEDNDDIQSIISRDASKGKKTVIKVKKGTPQAIPIKVQIGRRRSPNEDSSTKSAPSTLDPSTKKAMVKTKRKRKVTKMEKNTSPKKLRQGEKAAGCACM